MFWALMMQFRLVFPMRIASALGVAICSMWLMSQLAFATKGVALVIGNSAYQTVAQLMPRRWPRC